MLQNIPIGHVMVFRHQWINFHYSIVNSWIAIVFLMPEVPPIDLSKPFFRENWVKTEYKKCAIDKQQIIFRLWK